MTEEIKNGEQTPNTEEVKTPELTPIEQKAMEMGWRPKTEFEGEEDDFIDAKEFVRRKPLFDKIETQSRELKNVRKAIEALKEHYGAREKAAVRQAIDQLTAAKEEAISNADGAAVTRIEKEIKAAEKEHDRIEQLNKEPIVEDAPSVHPEFVSWKRQNEWYDNVGYMRAWADEFGIKLAQQGLGPQEVLKKVAEEVRKEFKHKFTNPNKANAPSVEGSSSKNVRAKDDDFTLSDQERKIMNTLVSTGTMTKEKYIAELKAIKGIK